MKLIYVSRARIPSRKAHVAQIHKMCDAFIEQGLRVQHVHPFRWKQLHSQEKPQEFYRLKHEIPTITLPSLDLPFLQSVSRKLWFWVYLIPYAFSVLGYLFWKKWFIREKFVIYCRDHVIFYLLNIVFIGSAPSIFLELHELPGSFSSELGRKLAKTGSGLIVTTNQIKKRLLKNSFENEFVHVAPDAVDLEKFDINLKQEQARECLDLADRGRIAMYLGRFHTMGKEKGIPEIIRASRKLFSQDLELDYYFVGGPQNRIQKYTELIYQEDLPNERFHFLGFQPPEQVPVYLKAANVLLMPFPWTEHYAYFMSPLKMFEYMASRRPIVATNLPSIREVLRDEKNAVLSRPGDPESLANCMKKVLEEPSLTNQIVDQAFRDVQQYTWENRSQTIIEFINLHK